MWKKRIVWKNDAIEFTFQDQVVSLEESIKDEELSFKATMKNGNNQIKEVELKVTLNTVSEENNNPVKAVMWKKKMVWKNDAVEFTFQDQVVSLEESINDDDLNFKATMKNSIQIKEVELKMTLKTVSEDNNNPLKAGKQENYEQGSSRDPVKLEEEKELTARKNKQKGNVTDSMDVKEPDAKKRRELALKVAVKPFVITISKMDAIGSNLTVDGIKKKVNGVQSLGNNTATIKDGQLMVQGTNQAEAFAIARKLAAGEAGLGSMGGKQVLVMLGDKVA